MPTIATPSRMSAKVEESGGGKGSTLSTQVPFAQRQLSVLLKVITTGLQGFIPRCKDAGLGVCYGQLWKQDKNECPDTDRPIGVSVQC